MAEQDCTNVDKRGGRPNSEDSRRSRCSQVSRLILISDSWSGPIPSCSRRVICEKRKKRSTYFHDSAGACLLDLPRSRSDCLGAKSRLNRQFGGSAFCFTGSCSRGSETSGRRCPTCPHAQPRRLSGSKRARNHPCTT